MLNLKFKLGCLIAAGMIASTAHAEECGEVSLMKADWGSAQIVTAVSKFLMEEGYGCEVTTVPLSTNPALVSVSETGEPDILTEIWTNGAPAYKGLLESGAIIQVTEVLSDGGVEGFFVPNYLLEKHSNITVKTNLFRSKEVMHNKDIFNQHY